MNNFLINFFLVPSNVNYTPNTTPNSPKQMTIISKTEEFNRQPIFPSTQGSCGRSKVGQGQVIGGKFITRGAYPWLVI